MNPPPRISSRPPMPVLLRLGAVSFVAVTILARSLSTSMWALAAALTVVVLKRLFVLPPTHDHGSKFAKIVVSWSQNMSHEKKIMRGFFTAVGGFWTGPGDAGHQFPNAASSDARSWTVTHASPSRSP